MMTDDEVREIQERKDCEPTYMYMHKYLNILRHDIDRLLADRAELVALVERKREVDGELKALFELIDQERFDEARSAIAALERKLGEDDPELTRARSLIHFLDGVDYEEFIMIKGQLIQDLAKAMEAVLTDMGDDVKGITWFSSSADDYTATGGTG